MSQIEVTKIVETVYMAPPPDTVSVSKIVMTLWLMPGSEDGVEPDRQVHVYTQKVRR